MEKSHYIGGPPEYNQAGVFSYEGPGRIATYIYFKMSSQRMQGDF